MALADQLSIKLVVAFSEPGQPLTLTSDPEEADESTIPDIFCAIATTTCDQVLTVKTPSDPQPTTSGNRTGSSTSFLDRHGSRARDNSVGANGASEDGGEDRNVRRRLNSEQPVRRGRLSMSSQPSRVNNSVPTTTSKQTVNTRHTIRTSTITILEQLVCRRASNLDYLRRKSKPLVAWVIWTMSWMPWTTCSTKRK
jgi:hypothetical protein